MVATVPSHRGQRTTRLSRRAFIAHSLWGSAALGVALVGCAAPAAGPAAQPTTAPAAPAVAAKPTEAPKPAEKPAPAAQQAPAKAGTKVKLQYWHVWGADRIPLMDAQVKAFQEKYPDIEVEHQYIVIADLNVKVLTALAGGDPPDVFSLRRAEMPSFVTKDALLPMDDLLARDKTALDELVYPSEAYHCRFDGKTYSLPQASGGGSFILYYGKGTYQQAGLNPEAGPKTWKELADHHEKLTKLNGGAIERLGIDIHQATDESYGFDGWLYTNNGKLIADDGKGPAFNSPEGLATLEWMVEFHKAQGGWSKVRDFTGGSNKDPGKIRPMLYQGLLGIMNHNVSVPFFVSKEAPEFQWGAATIPFNDANTQAKSVSYDLGGWGTSIPKGAKNVDAAWEWVKWNTLGPGNEAFLRAQGRPSPVKAHTEAYGRDPEVVKVNPNWKVFEDTLASTVPIPKTPVWPKLRDLLAQRVEQALLGQMSPKDALATAEREAQAEFARGG
jgi:multiple sugar transport system substrate-binding protein